MRLDLELLALFYFSMASAGFVWVLFRYGRGSQLRLWGIRACHILGFLGVACLRLNQGHFTRPELLIVSSLTVSLIAFEVSSRYLKTG